MMKMNKEKSFLRRCNILNRFLFPNYPEYVTIPIKIQTGSLCVIWDHFYWSEYVRIILFCDYSKENSEIYGLGDHNRTQQSK